MCISSSAQVGACGLGDNGLCVLLAREMGGGVSSMCLLENSKDTILSDWLRWKDCMICI